MSDELLHPVSGPLLRLAMNLLHNVLYNLSCASMGCATTHCMISSAQSLSQNSCTPLLSDHAFVVADCSCPLPPSTTSTACRQVRNWRGLDVDAFEQSELFQAPPLDPETAFRCYDQTLRHLLDQHAPLITKRVSLGQSVEWYDSECRAMKRTTRRLFQANIVGSDRLTV